MKIYTNGNVISEHKIVGIVTLYYPNKDVVERVKKIAKQVDYIYLCDNSLEDNWEMFKKISNCTYVAYQKNLGLAEAFNYVLKKLDIYFNDDDYLIFFDQDSQIEDRYIEKLCLEYELVEKKYNNLGCLGVVFYNTSNDTLEVPRIKTYLVSKTYQVSNIITSSLLTRFRNLKKVNYWNNNLFLDFVDWDLCWRMKNKGLICGITEEIILNHSVGNGERKIGFIRLRIGQPIREYYQTRDALYLLKEHYVPIKMRVRLLANVTIRPIVHFLLLDNKIDRLMYIKRGIIDYKKDIHGEYQVDK